MLTSQRRREHSLMITILAPILKGRGRMRAVLLFQSFFIFAWFSVREPPNGNDNDSFQRAFLLAPARDDDLKMEESAVRSQLPIDGQASASSVNSQSSLRKVVPNKQQVPNLLSEEESFESLLERGNLLSIYTGCSIAAWTYGWHENKPRLASYYDDCGLYAAEKHWTGRDITIDTVSDIQPGDSIYVELMKLSHFVQHLLPLINVEIILISGQNHIAPMKPPLKPPYNRRTFRRVVDNPNVKFLFMMNLDKHSYDPFHPKHHPFPYGLSYVAQGGGIPADFNPEAKSIYLKELRQHADRTKKNKVFVGYLNPDSNPNRAAVPSGEKLPPDQYYKTMHESKYVLSPDGDRPECYCHYEAIGLGTMPITQLHPHLYRHLAGSVVFNETKWDVSEMETTLSPNPTVNRQLLFEEYWMEYVEKIVGRSVRWWDLARRARVRASMVEFS